MAEAAIAHRAVPRERIDELLRTIGGSGIGNVALPALTATPIDRLVDEREILSNREIDVPSGQSASMSIDTSQRRSAFSGLSAYGATPRRSSVRRVTRSASLQSSK